MDPEWMDDLTDDDLLFGCEESADFYCPYTNGAKCALIVKGWQPQELCESIDCSQLRLFTRSHKSKAA
ncbi:MAG: hypothetical protein ABFD49_09055 [Armatimonadota bacterium]|nr:hypothetical protein [bacterium]